MKTRKRDIGLGLLAILLAVLTSECVSAEPLDAALRGTVEPVCIELHLRVTATPVSAAESSVFQGGPIQIRVSLRNATIQERYTEWREQLKSSREDAVLRGISPTLSTQYVVPTSGVVRVTPACWTEYLQLELRYNGETEEDRMGVLVWPDKDFGKLLRKRQVRQQRTEELALLDRSAVFAIPPEISSTLKPGYYEVVAILSPMGVEPPEAMVADAVGRCVFEVKVKPTSAEGVTRFAYGLVEYYAEVGDPDATIQYAEEVLALDPAYDSSGAYRWLGHAYEQKGMVAEAVEAYEVFLKKNEGNRGWNYPRVIRLKVDQLRQKLNQQAEPD